jgi:hypothetical protein
MADTWSELVRLAREVHETLRAGRPLDSRTARRLARAVMATDDPSEVRVPAPPLPRIRPPMHSEP